MSWYPPRLHRHRHYNIDYRTAITTSIIAPPLQHRLSHRHYKMDYHYSRIRPSIRFIKMTVFIKLVIFSCSGKEDAKINFICWVPRQNILFESPSSNSFFEYLGRTCCVESLGRNFSGESIRRIYSSEFVGRTCSGNFLGRNAFFESLGTNSYFEFLGTIFLCWVRRRNSSRYVVTLTSWKMEEVQKQ